MSTGLAHEIKNPLTAVKGFIQLLSENHYHHYLDIISSELEKALSTINNLLHVAKPELENEPSTSLNLCSELESLLFLFKDQFYRVEIEKRFYDKEQNIIGRKNLILKA
uniref:histidine kinase dimerization/phospho-acceptor domain-containing protein n=1 Tax=Neobacillus cucumis TaxID=1740721 RepID=UPI0035B55F42